MLEENGAVRCWGRNSRGQLGDGTLIGKLVPTRVDTSVPIDQISVGDSHTCAQFRDGIVRCWGDDSRGELGEGTPIYRATPTEVER